MGCVCICVCICVNFVCVFKYVCAFVCLNVCCVYLYMCVCMSVSVLACVSVCMFVCVCIHRIAGMFGNGKVWRIWQVVCDSPKPKFSLLMVSLWLTFAKLYFTDFF